MDENPILQRKSNYIKEKLKGLGIKNVYIDPPETLLMQYPCARVRMNAGRSRYADNKTHIFTPSWEIIWISHEPDDEMMLKIIYEFPMITSNRHYTADGLHHYAFILYY